MSESILAMSVKGFGFIFWVVFNCLSTQCTFGLSLQIIHS